MNKIKVWILSGLAVLLTFGLYFPVMAYADEDGPNYLHETNEYGNDRIIGFEYLNDYYLFEYDDRGIITYICDSVGNRIAYYCCDSIGNVIGIYSVGNAGWELNEDVTFIGNINKIRWMGYEYDKNSDCYIVGNRYFSVQNQKYLDGVDNSFALSDTNPFLYKYKNGIMPMDAQYSDMAAEEWKNALLNDESYGGIYSYSSDWYNGLSTVELLARCIYAEGGTAYPSEGAAVAWVILNRLHSANFPNTPWDIITAYNQFATITGGEVNTGNARDPKTEDYRWENATYLACLMLTTTDKNEWRALIGDKINGQLFFYSYTYAKNHGGSPFFGANSENLYCGSTHITNVYVLGYGPVDSFDELFNNYSPIDGSRNIYYDYY